MKADARPRAAVFAVAVAVVLADSSIVTLGLPDIVRDFDTSVAEVARVLISFNLVLALAAVPAARAIAGRGAVPAWRAGVAMFALSSLACALAPSLWVLVAARCAQAVAGAAVLAAALELMSAELGRERAVATWARAGILGAALGPAVGGALTELLSWEAIFAAQVPLIVAVAAGGRLAGRPGERWTFEAPPAWTLAALALVSAALTAALFLLVVMLIEGWRLSPAAAAAVVTIMPAAALITGPLTRHAGDARTRAAAGTVAIAGGLAALGLLPGAAVGWTIAPQVLIGFGLGLSLSALTEQAVSGPRVASRAATTIAARHAGVVLGLALLTPVFTADLDEQEEAAQRAGSALLLDARLGAGTKIELGGRLAQRVAGADGRLPDMRPAFRGLEADHEERVPLRELRDRLSDEVQRAATQAFSASFLAGAGLALLVLVPVALSRRGRS